MTTYVTFHKVTSGGVTDGQSFVSSTISESVSNQQSAAATRQFVTVCATVAIYVAIGSNPDATVTTARHYQPANIPKTYGISEGNKIAVVSA